MLWNTIKKLILYSSGAIFKTSLMSKRVASFIDGHALKLSGFPSLEKRHNTPYQILLYHRILPKYDPFAIDVLSIDNFRAHLRILSSFFRIVTIEEVVSELEKGELSANTICITFDDGYYDNFQYAFPVLKEFRIQATIFLTTDLVGTNKMLWPDKVFYYIKSTELDVLEFQNDKKHFYDLSNITRRMEAAHNLLEWMKKLIPEERDRKIQELKEICQVKSDETQRMMLNWDEIKDMNQAGITFGAHTKTHPILSSLDNDKIEEEIVESKETIENILNKPVVSFAYPNGKNSDFDNRCKGIVKKAGFKCAVTSYGSVNYAHTDPYELSRFSPWELNPNLFLGRILFERLKK